MKSLDPAMRPSRPEFDVHLTKDERGRESSIVLPIIPLEPSHP